MATNSPITGVRVDAPNFQTFDLVEMDNLSADMEVLRSMIDVAIDIFDSSPKNAQCLLFGALNQLDRATERHHATHDALVTLKRREA